MDKLNNRATDRGGALRETLSETYLPLESAVLSHTSLSQEYSTKAIVSVGVFRPVAFTNVGGFTWQSSNSAVCNVTKISNFEAEISFLAIGNCEITVTHPDLAGIMTISCVSKSSVSRVTITGTFSVNPFDSYQFGVQVLPDDAPDKRVTWSSDNTGLATVTSNGLVTNKNKAGIVTIVATSVSNTSINGKKSIAIKDPLNVWPKRDSGVTNTILGITYGNGIYVAVGTRGTILTSPDTITWTKRDSGVTDNLNGTTYGNGLYVAVGNDGIILTSPDTITWTKRDVGVTNTILGITYGNGIYVAVGLGTILTSPDGITWTKRDSRDAGYLNGTTYGNGIYVAVGNGGDILTATDAITWTKRDSEIAGYLNGTTYGNGIYVAVGNGGVILTSPDGIVWTTKNVPTDNLFGITYGNGFYVAVGSGGVILTSPDGIVWTTKNVPTDNLFGITYGNGFYVAVGSGGDILTCRVF